MEATILLLSKLAPSPRRNIMAQDRIGGIVRALVGVPQERLAVLQGVVNGLNSAFPSGDEFQVDLSKFVAGWKPEVSTAIVHSVSDLNRWSDNYDKLFNRRRPAAGD